MRTHVIFCSLHKINVLFCMVNCCVQSNGPESIALSVQAACAQELSADGLTSRSSPKQALAILHTAAAALATASFLLRASTRAPPMASSCPCLAAACPRMRADDSRTVCALAPVVLSSASTACDSALLSGCRSAQMVLGKPAW